MKAAEIIVLPCMAVIAKPEEYDKLQKPLRNNEAILPPTFTDFLEEELGDLAKMLETKHTLRVGNRLN